MPKDFTIVVIGSGAVGKSALSIQFVQGKYVNDHISIEDSYYKTIEVDGKQYALEILDMAGTEQYTSIRDEYMKKAHGFVLVYTITSTPTFNYLSEMIDKIFEFKGTKSVPMVIVGNKCDLSDRRSVTIEQGEDLARKFNAPFLETSAKENINVERIFYDLIKHFNMHWHSRGIKGDGQKIRGCQIL
eukprot:TRINITY_DN4627_c0_g1_i1.p1 TRINITY_DN4627_c0_g1~~TRINITY_DN4627_c0_g1_i1.p1  ORF type:complete len:187 (+),score=22.84 TRINITY_DN4627_c0_g1_i1:119-679(+)